MASLPRGIRHCLRWLVWAASPRNMEGFLSSPVVSRWKQSAVDGAFQCRIPVVATPPMIWRRNTKKSTARGIDAIDDTAISMGKFDVSAD